MLAFIDKLTEIGDFLKTIAVEGRKPKLKELLREVNDMFYNSPGLYMPLLPATAQYHYILRISIEDAIVLNSRDRAPYLLYLEVIEYDEGHLSDENIHEYTKLYKKEIDKIYKNIQRESLSIEDFIDVWEIFENKKESEKLENEKKSK